MNACYALSQDFVQNARPSVEEVGHTGPRRVRCLWWLRRTQDQPPGKGKGCTNSTVDPTRLCPVICCPMPKRITDDNAV